MTTLANRPAAHLISFAAECFETVGTQEEYSVLNPFGRSGPEKFGTDFAAAKAHADKCGREVQVSTVQVKRRVRWN